MKKKEITVSQLEKMFELFQEEHPEYPSMHMTFDAFMVGNGIRPTIYYGISNCC